MDSLIKGEKKEKNLPFSHKAYWENGTSKDNSLIQE